MIASVGLPGREDHHWLIWYDALENHMEMKMFKRIADWFRKKPVQPIQARPLSQKEREQIFQEASMSTYDAAHSDAWASIDVWASINETHQSNPKEN